ncbi:serine hydrolase [uncultured Algimonas sp.]|uniref:serine hydrolase domain-containing protein n=1 Tax=uncultured Algimonas sp. TaxID=1547920 RepID=UPI0026201A77|nr:serine hydrolase [uncultured Algimonas sp.]
MTRIILLIVLLLAAAAPARGQNAVGGHVVAATDRTDRVSLVAQGVANPESRAEVGADTVFHIASLSKQITAAALAFAILEERVSLDDPVATHFPEARHLGEDLTVGHLLYFTSGLSEAYDLPRAGGIPWTTHHYFTVEDAIETSLAQKTLKFPPGSRWDYNNINYQLIAELIARLYERPFSEVVAEKIFDPLGMTASLIHDDTTRIIPNRAEGLVPRTKEFVEQLRSVGVEASLEGGPVLIRRNAPHYGGSGVMTSMADWLLWQREMLSGAVFGDAFWEVMMSTRSYDHDKANDAFGLVKSEFEGAAILWFSGGDIDGTSYMLASPELGLAAACFSNNPTFDCRSEAQTAFRDARP